MMLRRIGVVLVCAIGGLVAVWVAVLVLLPDAPPRDGGSAVPISAPAGTANPAGMLAVPIAGVARSAIVDSWGDPRDNGLRAHHGTDIPAAANTPVRAVAAGTIEKIRVSEAGGNVVYVRAPDRHWTFYYAHLAGYAPGLHEGQAVASGTILGYVGDTGDAGAGNYHLHFGLTRTTPEQRWYEGDDVDPYPYLAGRRLPG